MVSLWGTKKDDRDRDEATQDIHDGEGSRRAAPPPPRQSVEADERTRLIPPPSRHDGYLDPDDPAVSPYNLWSVRALRYLAVLCLVVSFLWWVLLLVSIFVSPPGMNTRGSGFFDFSYSTVTLGNLLVGILFFSVPSKALEVFNAITALFLLVDMVIIVSVTRLRAEEGWVGIVSIFWATAMAFFMVITDRVVAWGKREEEERLTGRHETKRSLKEWLAIVTYTIIMTIIVLVVVLMTATLGIRARDASLSVPGVRWRVDDGKYDVHLDCIGNITRDDTGNTLPTILVEAGKNPFEGTMAPFFHGAYVNGSIPRYCYWDRPGYAFSDNAPSPHSAGMSVDALSEALAQAGEEGPWILVSAGIGAIHSRIFSSRHLGDVKALMIIDGLHEDLLYKLGSAGRGFLLWAYGIISPLGWERIPAAIFKGRTREDRVFGLSAYQQGKFIKAQLQENLVAKSFTKSEVSQARNIQDKDIPLVVVSSGIHYRTDEEWAKKQEDLTKITNNLVAWDIVNKAPQEVWKTFQGRQILERRMAELVRL